MLSSVAVARPASISRDWAAETSSVREHLDTEVIDVPTLETLAATDLLRRHLPDLRLGSSTSWTSCDSSPPASIPTV